MTNLANATAHRSTSLVPAAPEHASDPAPLAVRSPELAMRAVQGLRYGAPDVLSLVEVRRPSPRRDEVLVEVRASAVTQGDRRVRAADFPGAMALPGRLAVGLTAPRHAVQGTNFAGRVAAIGEGVTRFAVGDEVFGLAPHGAHAEYLVVAEGGAIARAPSGLAVADAAALPYGATTALSFLRDLARVRPGDRVAILGASGEVGRFAVQVARHLGAEVTGVCSRDRDLVAELGAHDVVDLDSLLASGRRFDVIFDTAPVSRFSRLRGSLAPQGRYLGVHVTLGSLTWMAMSSLLGGPRAIVGVSLPGSAEMDALRELVDAGALRPVIARRFPLASVSAAHAFLEAGPTRGSVVVDVRE